MCCAGRCWTSWRARSAVTARRPPSIAAILSLPASCRFWRRIVLTWLQAQQRRGHRPPWAWSRSRPRAMATLPAATGRIARARWLAAPGRWRHHVAVGAVGAAVARRCPSRLRPRRAGRLWRPHPRLRLLHRLSHWCSRFRRCQPQLTPGTWARRGCRRRGACHLRGGARLRRGPARRGAPRLRPRPTARRRGACHCHRGARPLTCARLTGGVWLRRGHRSGVPARGAQQGRPERAGCIAVAGRALRLGACPRTRTLEASVKPCRRPCLCASGQV